MGWYGFAEYEKVNDFEDAKNALIKGYEDQLDTDFLFTKHEHKKDVFLIWTMTKDHKEIILFLTKYAAGGIMYKILCDKDGPLYYSCPKYFLKHIEPTENKIANIWRQKIKKNKGE